MPEHPVVDEEGGGRTPFALSYFLHYHYHYRQPRTANFFFFFKLNCFSIFLLLPTSLYTTSAALKPGYTSTPNSSACWPSQRTNKFNEITWFPSLCSSPGSKKLGILKLDVSLGKYRNWSEDTGVSSGAPLLGHGIGVVPPKKR